MDKVFGTAMTTISVPRCKYVAEEFALDIMGWTASQLRYAQDYNGFPLPVHGMSMLVLDTDAIAHWARSRQYQVVRHTIGGT